MSSASPPAKNARGWVRVLIAFVIAFDVAAFFQWADGAMQSEFGGHAEEAQNYLAALRTRDALVHAQDRGIADGENHTVSEKGYKRGFQHALGAWMAVFGTSRIASLLFMAALAAATAVLIFHTVQRESGLWPATVASLLWICAPAVRESYETILPEQSGALILSGAALLWVQMMIRRSPGITIAPKWIGIVALLGIAAVLALAGSQALGIASGNTRAAATFLRECLSVLGIAATAFAIAGAAIRSRSSSRTDAVRVAMLALAAGVLAARWLKSDMTDVRLLIVATPALAILSVHGALALASLVGPQAIAPEVAARRRTLWVFLLLLLALPTDLLHAWRKDWRGFGAIADSLIDEARGPAHVLVVSDARGEGMFQSEIAMRARARQITVERGSRTLAESGGTSPHTKPHERFADDQELIAYLTAGRIRYIVLDGAIPYETHASYHDQVRQVLEGNIRHFWPTTDSVITRDGEPQGRPLKIYRVIVPGSGELP